MIDLIISLASIVKAEHAGRCRVEGFSGVELHPCETCKTIKALEGEFQNRLTLMRNAEVRREALDRVRFGGLPAERYVSAEKHE